jgi:transcription elongation factor GreA
MGKVFLTNGGLKKLRDELEVLKTIKRKEVIDRIAEAISQGDLSENADYAQAKDEQSFVEGRIFQIEHTLKQAEIIEANHDKETVSMGATVTVQVNGKQMVYTIVGASETNPGDGKISNESIVGKTLLGTKKGDKVSIETRAGQTYYEIITIEYLI